MEFELIEKRVDDNSCQCLENILQLNGADIRYGHIIESANLYYKLDARAVHPDIHKDQMHTL